MCSDMQLQYPPRGYKNVQELGSSEIEKSRLENNDYLNEIDECIYAPTTGSQVVEFYKGKSIFITGGTGFLGKLVVEKLLRSCRDIGTIYLLIRPKRGKQGDERIQNLLDNVIFTHVKKVDPSFGKKIVLIEGDISMPKLGIAEADQRILENKVNVIFHLAATINFDEQLKIAAAINVGGTNEILTLASQCKNLSSMVYVSTAYSNCIRKEIGEEIYDAPYKADELLEMVKQEEITLHEKSIIGKFPNTYTFTKSIAENTVKFRGKDLPVCIFRPGMVISTNKEPLKSWVDNYSGGIGVIANTFRGISRCFHCNPKKVCEVVPVDYVVNGIIVAGFQNQFKRDGEIKVYNYVSSPENPLIFGDLVDLSTFYGRQIPSLKSMWYPVCTLEKNFYLYLLMVIILHIIPALLFDTFMIISGSKPWMVAAYKKVYKFSQVLAYFSTREWKFRNDNVQHLWNSLSEVDKKLFAFSMSKNRFNWNEYLSTMSCGIRKYLFREDLTTLPQAQKKHKKLYFYHRLYQVVFGSIMLLLLSWCVLSFFSCSTK